MEHIRTPVCVHKELNRWYLQDSTCGLLVGAPRDYIPREVMEEIAQAVNERDPLVAQRDALVAACIVSRQLLADIAKDYAVILQDAGMDAMHRCVEQATRAALALVEADQKSDDATT